MEAGLIFSLNVLFDLKIDKKDQVRMAQIAENEFVGVNTGILDQYSSSMGREGSALLLDCRELTSEEVKIADDLQVV